MFKQLRKTWKYGLDPYWTSTYENYNVWDEKYTEWDGIKISLDGKKNTSKHEDTGIKITKNETDKKMLKERKEHQWPAHWTTSNLIGHIIGVAKGILDTEKICI